MLNEQKVQRRGHREASVENPQAWRMDFLCDSTVDLEAYSEVRGVCLS